MRRLIPAPWLAVFLVSFASAFAADPVQTHLNGISAIVNDTVISRDRVMAISRAEITAAQRTARTDDEFNRTANKIIEDTLDRLIDRRLIVDEFKTKGYVMPDSAVDELVRDRIRRDFGGDRIVFARTLREENKTFEDFRREEYESIVVYQMSRKNISEEVVISPKKIEKYYKENLPEFHVGDRVKLRMIVVDRSKHAIGEPEKLGKELLERLKKGEDFAKLADEFSDYNKSAKGGDRGWIENKDADLRKELRDIIFKMSPGGIETANIGGTVFLLKVEERRPEETKTLNEARVDIESKLKDAERKRLEDAWIKRLRKKAFIRYF
ncbi:MAG TPA: peptidyl-prolyl cis-trans isomerase [Candidatus Limnocylindria bacterium]|jgi:parvulin-like peptidyl-prolyl isomerase|nr:peptidyl-prolyl cis-trans isomerase [Candidatus Limnocylindria bacterium]